MLGFAKGSLDAGVLGFAKGSLDAGGTCRAGGPLASAQRLTDPVQSRGGASSELDRLLGAFLLTGSDSMDLGRVPALEEDVA